MRFCFLYQLSLRNPPINFWAFQILMQHLPFWLCCFSLSTEKHVRLPASGGSQDKRMLAFSYSRGSWTTTWTSVSCLSRYNGVQTISGTFVSLIVPVICPHGSNIMQCFVEKQCSLLQIIFQSLRNSSLLSSTSKQERSDHGHQVMTELTTPKYVDIILSLKSYSYVLAAEFYH